MEVVVGDVKGGEGREYTGLPTITLVKIVILASAGLLLFPATALLISIGADSELVHVSIGLLVYLTTAVLVDGTVTSDDKCEDAVLR